MAGHSRYSVSNRKAGIKNGILENKLGISNQKELEDAETILLSDAYEFFFSKNKLILKDFDVKFLFSVNKYFLETLYAWAGKRREVDISKDGIMCASAKYLSSSVEYFGKILKGNMPRMGDTKNSIASKIAIIHNEFNAIHPFRDGNGRTIRLLIDLIASVLGYEPIDWNSKSKREYMKACVSGIRGNHKPMANFLLERLKKSIK